MVTATNKATIGSYLNCLLTAEGFKKNVVTAVKRLRPYKDEFDTVAFRGMSGALVGPTVAHKLGKDIIFVRKDEKRHTSFQVEGVKGGRYIIIDDFIASGETVRAIHGEIKKHKLSAELVGVFLYNADDMNESALKLQKELKVWFLHVGTKELISPDSSKKK